MSKLQVRQRLARGEEFVLQSLMGGVLGLLVGTLILVFHRLIDLGIAWVGHPSTWQTWQILCYPIIGAGITAWAFKRYAHRRSLGTGHVIEVLHQSPKHWPTTNSLLQFVLTPILLASGQSGGREGPAVHLGSTLGAMMTERLKLPRNNLRVFVGAGAAAAIGGSFLTPLAGVAFAMEVIVMEYTVAGFLPVITAAVAASALVQAITGEPLVPFPTFTELAQPHLLWVLLIGVGCGLLAALFNYSTRQAERYRPRYSIFLAGVLCAGVGIVAPNALGDGHDLWGQLAAGEMTIALIAGWIVAKLAMTTIVVGWGLPLGLISPLLLLGAGAGSMVSLAAAGEWLPAYALIGMVSTMGAALMAPLAALIFVIELSGQTTLMLPAMLALTLSLLTHRLCGQGALFVDQLADRGIRLNLHQSNHPLHHLGVQSALQTSVAHVPVRFAGLPAPASHVIWRQGPRQMGCLEWSAFVLACESLQPGDLLTQLNAPTLGRIEGNSTLAEMMRQCRSQGWQGAYLLEQRKVRGIIIEKNLRESFQ